MRVLTTIVFTVVTGGLSLIVPLAFSAAQNAVRTPILVTIVVRDAEGGATGLTSTVQLYGEAQDGTVYTGSPRTKGEQWVFEVPGPGTYTAEVSAPGYKTTQKMITVIDRNENLQIDVILELDTHPGKAKGNSILAPKARAELEKGKRALGEKQFDEARGHLEKALQLAPTSAEGNYYAGLLYYYTGNLDAALDHLQRSVSMNHENGPALLAIGEVYYKQKDYAHATNVLEQGLTLEPNSWRAEALLGSSYYRQANYERGREHAQKALTIGKDEASGTGFLLGKCLAALGRKTEAIAALQTFLEREPASDMTRAAEAMLKQLQAAP